MDSLEREIVKKYIKKHKQDRILWELNTSKKRNSVFWHFADQSIFKEECLQPISYMNKRQLKKYLFELSGASTAYYIGEDYIGHASLDQAVERADIGKICIIYCGKGIGYYQGEQVIGAPPRFMLLAKD